jgi:hypothetical protein
MNLKLLNVIAVALLAVAWRERRRRASSMKLLGAAALVDAIILVTLMTQRGAATTAGSLAMTPARIVHIVTSALFPLLYPFLLLGDETDGDQDGEARLHGLLLLTLLALRYTSFWTSYFMGAA